MSLLRRQYCPSPQPLCYHHPLLVVVIFTVAPGPLSSSSPSQHTSLSCCSGHYHRRAILPISRSLSSAILRQHRDCQNDRRMAQGNRRMRSGLTKFLSWTCPSEVVCLGSVIKYYLSSHFLKLISVLFTETAVINRALLRQIRSQESTQSEHLRMARLQQTARVLGYSLVGSRPFGVFPPAFGIQTRSPIFVLFCSIFQLQLMAAVENLEPI